MKAHRSGFTLIELVVVIMILGILAGVAAPKLLSVSGQATDNGIKQTLSIVRDAIELYVADSGGALPPCTSTGADFRLALVPYIRGVFPSSPVGDTAGTAAAMDIEATTGTGATATEPATSGWKFNTTDGTFVCNSGDATVSDSSVTYDEL